MIVASSQSVELDEQRAELRSVLESAQFVRAPKLAQFLSYLCEKFFSGQSGQIKEYSIGVEVFGRGDSFDQNTDSIVRVEANRLRKRLAEYYGSDGASHRLRITIPVGQYVPDFEPGPAARGETELPAAPTPVLSQPEVPALAPGRGRFRTPGPRLRIVIPSAFIVLSTLALALICMRMIQRQDHPSAEATPANPTPSVVAESPFGPPPGD